MELMIRVPRSSVKDVSVLHVQKVAGISGSEAHLLSLLPVHADVYGMLAGRLAPVPVRVSTKHGFNEFREGRTFALADRTVASLADVHIAISRGLARYLADTEGFDERGFEIVHYGIAPRDEPQPYAGK